MVIDNATDDKREQWTADGPHGWAMQTGDGYQGHAHWRKTGAGIAVTRPDGTDLLRKSWGSKEIFPHSWPAMFEWLKGRVTEQIAAERSKGAASAVAPS
jgi:hypothetical protein